MAGVSENRKEPPVQLGFRGRGEAGSGGEEYHGELGEDPVIF